jgi:large subunit ribosomal protein L6
MAIEKRLEIPEGVSIQLEGARVIVNGPKGTLERDLCYPGIDVRQEDNEFIVSTDSKRRKVTAMVGTITAHTRNMCTGVTEGYEYSMKVVYSHFPIQLKIAGNRLEIVNFLGEKESRFARIDDGVDVKLGNDELTITGINKETVGTTAARIELATKVRNRDPRVFQDGIYIIQKA